MYNDGFVFKFYFRAACCVIAHLPLTVLFFTNFQPSDASAIVVLSLHAMKTRCAIMHVSHFFMDKGFTASVHLNQHQNLGLLAMTIQSFQLARFQCIKGKQMKLWHVRV